MMDFQRKIEKENKAAHNIKKKILMYNAANDISNPKAVKITFKSKGSSKRVSPNITAGLTFLIDFYQPKIRRNNDGDLKLFSSDNPNLLKRRKSQDGGDAHVKKVPLDFQDLFELKQKLLVPHSKKSNDNVLNWMFDSKEKLNDLKRTPSPSKAANKK